MAEMTTTPAATRGRNRPAAPLLDTEIASRRLDPFEVLYLGLLRTNDPLLLEKGGAGSGAELYRDLKRDGKVFSCLQKRILALVGRPWQVEPVQQGAQGTADAEALTDILKKAQFDRLCAGLMEALLPGTAITEIVWTIRDGMYAVRRAPRRALRRFVFVQPDDAPPALRQLTRANMLTGEPLPDRVFIVHRINPEDDNPWGTGLGLQLYWAVFFKRKAMISWNKLNDRLGVPTPWGKHPRNAGAKEKATLFDALKALSNDGVVVTPEGSSIELLESKALGNVTTQQALCEYMDDWIAEVLLGQEPRKGGGGAMAAASKERQAVRLDIVQADADLLSDTLNSTLIPWLCELNGFVPCLVSRVIKEEEDLKASAETDEIVAGMGFELDVDTVRAKYGDGWTKKAAPPPPPPVPAVVAPPAAASAAGAGKKNPPAAGSVQFAEPGIIAGQQAIDDAVAALPDAQLQAALQGLMAPLLQAIEAAGTYEDALAAAEAAYPRMDKAKLQSLLARAMFGAETFGRLTDD